MDDELGLSEMYETPKSVVAASVLSGVAQLLKTIFMVVIDLAALGATIYFAVEGRWALFVGMLVIGLAVVSFVADFASGVLIAPFVFLEAILVRREERRRRDVGRFRLGAASPVSSATVASAPVASPPLASPPPASLLAAPLASPSDLSTPEPPRTSRGASRRRALVWRAISVTLFVVIGAVVAKGRPANGVYYHGTGELVSALVIGAIVSLLFLAVVGSIGFVFSRRSANARRRSWRQTVFGRQAMIVTLVLLLASAAGRAASHQQAVQNAVANSNGTLVQREKANQDARDWSVSRTPLMRAFIAAVRRDVALDSALGKQGNTPAIRAMVNQIGATFNRIEAQAAALAPAPLPGLQSLDAKFKRATRLSAEAFAEYTAGLTANSADGTSLPNDKGALALLDKGDAELKQSLAVIRAFTRQVSVLDKQYSIS